MAILEHLEPKSVFRFFEEMCAYPHGSGNTKQVSDWLVRFAEERGLEHYQDEWNNVIIIKEATPGYEDAPAIILQGHIDMVCEKAPDCAKDMAAEGLDLAVEGDTVRAIGTTLGADNGIAVAMTLAVLDDDSLPHPRVEGVFTSDEETGMYGAAALDVTPLKGKMLLNLDSEDEGVFTVSCAGGNVARLRLPVRREVWEGVPLTVTVNGLRGGHSGVEIDKGYGSAVTLLSRLLARMAKRTELRLLSVDGGLKDNAIPVAAEARLLAADEAAVKAVCAEMGALFAAELSVTDPGVTVSVIPGEGGLPMDAVSTEQTIFLLACAPNGVQVMSSHIPGLVQTSLNLGILATDEDAVSASFCIRSSMEEQKQMLVERLDLLSRQLGASLTVEGDYPGWAFRQDSPLRDLCEQVFTEQYGREAKIEALHAGLECGMFAGKIPGLDCLSLGPDLSEVHTFREKLHIASTARTWALLTEVLRRLK